jgi:hypothetical protein
LFQDLAPDISLELFLKKLQTGLFKPLLERIFAHMSQTKLPDDSVYYQLDHLPKGLLKNPLIHEFVLTRFAEQISNSPELQLLMAKNNPTAAKMRGFKQHIAALKKPENDTDSPLNAGSGQRGIDSK